MCGTDGGFGITENQEKKCDLSVCGCVIFIKYNLIICHFFDYFIFYNIPGSKSHTKRNEKE
jgi:hypothetical protein